MGLRYHEFKYLKIPKYPTILYESLFRLSSPIQMENDVSIRYATAQLRSQWDELSWAVTYVVPIMIIPDFISQHEIRKRMGRKAQYSIVLFYPKITCCARCNKVHADLRLWLRNLYGGKSWLTWHYCCIDTVVPSSCLLADRCQEKEKLWKLILERVIVVKQDFYIITVVFKRQIWLINGLSDCYRVRKFKNGSCWYTDRSDSIWPFTPVPVLVRKKIYHFQLWRLKLIHKKLHHGRMDFN
jgi:hypothetical protein